MGSFYHFSSPNPGAAMSPLHSEKKKKSRTQPVYSFTWFDVMVVVVSMGTYLADIITDILVTLVYWKLDEEVWAGLTLAFLIIPSIIMQIFSTRWYVADGHKATFSIFLIHILMMGPIKRYVAVLRHGIRAKKTKRIEDYQAMYSELSDVSMLRLFESFLESAPQLVLQLYIMIKVTEDDHILTGIAAFFSLISLAWAIASYTKALRTAAYSQDSRKNRVSWSGLVLQTLWRVGMVAGRIVALVMFATAYPVWLLGGVGVHWLVMAIWLVVQDTDFCGTWWEEKLFNAVVGVIHIFCFFNMKEGRSRWRMLIFYGLVLAENSVMIIMWFPHRTIGAWYNIPAMAVIWGGFAVGLASMLLYYRYFHPSSVKKCHCCMLYYHLVYRCCPCHDVTTFDGTPYHRNIGLHDDRDSSEIGNSVEDFLGFQDTGEEFTERYHGLMEYETPESLHCDFNNGRKTEHSSKKTDRKKLLMPEPKLTSTPADDLDDNFIAEYQYDKEMSLMSASKSSESDCYVAEDSRGNFLNDDAIGPLALTPSVLKNLPGGQTGPCTNKGNSTLVRQWVKKTQEIYEEQKDAGGKQGVSFADNGDASDFGTLRFATKEEREFMQIHFGDINAQPSGRRDILRLKSFSKRDREQLKRPKKRKRSGHNITDVRNTFREAFGFHTFSKDPSDAPEFDRKVKRIVRKQPKRTLKSSNNTWAVSEIDRCDPVKGENARRSAFSTQNEVKHLRKKTKTNPSSVHMILARIDQPPDLLGTPRARGETNEVKYKEIGAAIEVFDTEGVHEIEENYAKKGGKFVIHDADAPLWTTKTVQDFRVGSLETAPVGGVAGFDLGAEVDKYADDDTGKWGETDLDHSRHLKKMEDLSSGQPELPLLSDINGQIAGPEVTQKVRCLTGRKTSSKTLNLIGVKLWNTPKKTGPDVQTHPDVLTSVDAKSFDSSDFRSIPPVDLDIERALKMKEKSVYDNLTASILVEKDGTDSDNGLSNGRCLASDEGVKDIDSLDFGITGGLDMKNESGDNFGAVIQIRGDMVTVRHRNGDLSEEESISNTALEENRSEKSQNLISNLLFQPSKLRTNLQKMKPISNPVPENKEPDEKELISNPVLEENRSEKPQNLISNLVFRPSKLRANLEKAKSISNLAPENKEPGENAIISNLVFRPSKLRANLEKAKPISNPAPESKDQGENAIISNPEVRGIKLAGNSNAPIRRDRIEYLYKVGRQGLMKAAENSPARKRLSFKKSAKFSKENARISQPDESEAQNGSRDAENDPDLSKKMEKSIEALGDSMEDVIEEGENYKIHIAQSALYRKKTGRKSSLGSVKNRNIKSKKGEIKRRTLGAIENQS